MTYDNTKSYKKPRFHSLYKTHFWKNNRVCLDQVDRPNRKQCFKVKIVPRTKSIAYLVRFNTNSKYHFLTYMLTRLFTSTFQPLNLCMFTEEDSATINEDKKF